MISASFQSVQLEKTSFPKNWWILIGLLYLFGWLMVYLNMSFVPRAAFLGILLLIQLRSYSLGILIILMVSFIPFFGDFLRDVGISGITPLRALFIPFIYFSLNKIKLRKIPFNKPLLILILISIFTLKLTADIRLFIQEMPLESQSSYAQVGMVNVAMTYFDLLAKLFIIYFAFTRLTLVEINKLFDGLLLIILFEACTIAFLVYKNPEAVLGFSEDLKKSGQLNRIIWNNPFFGHKNDWGTMFALIMGIMLVKLVDSGSIRMFYVIIIIGVAIGLAFSLSRQAYLFAIIFILITIIGARNFKLIILTMFFVLALAVFQPRFLVERMGSTFETSSVEDFQSLNRKFSGLAIDQIERNFQLIPRMFFTDTWEYNWSEGFWNGMLHQQGIMGLLFHVFLYLFLFSRYLILFFSCRNKKLERYALIGVIMTILMFIAHFNRRTFHFMHYDGLIGYTNFLNIFIFSYLELVIYAFKNKLRDFVLL